MLMPYFISHRNFKQIKQIDTKEKLPTYQNKQISRNNIPNNKNSGRLTNNLRICKVRTLLAEAIN